VRRREVILQGRVCRVAPGRNVGEEMGRERRRHVLEWDRVERPAIKSVIHEAVLVPVRRADLHDRGVTERAVEVVVSEERGRLERVVEKVYVAHDEAGAGLADYSDR